jgi:hypothetical protein
MAAFDAFIRKEIEINAMLVKAANPDELMDQPSSPARA